MFDDCQPQCAADCTWVFGRVRVRPSIQHGTWVEWLMHPEFRDPQPYTYQLQVGHTGSNLADDWQDVGLPIANVTYAIDDTQRVYGKTQWTHYRIKLTTPQGTYYSAPQQTWGDLPFRFWRLVANRERIYRRQFTATSRAQEGYLLKVRLTGARPELGDGVLDYQTEEVTNPQSPETVGKEFIGGYYAPIPCVWMDPDTKITRREHRDAGEARGTVNDGLRVKAVMLATPQVDSYDVWVDRINDFRWEIHEIEHLEAIQGVPIAIRAELRLLPFSHPVYALTMPHQET